MTLVYIEDGPTFPMRLFSGEISEQNYQMTIQSLS